MEPDPSAEQPPALIDQAGELQQNGARATGQLWRVGEHRLLCGDATKAEDVVRLMGDERAVLFETDPPYAVGYTGGSHLRAGAIMARRTEIKIGPGKYVEARSADVKNNEEAGVELYRGFIEMAIQSCDSPQRRLVSVGTLQRRQMMLE